MSSPISGFTAIPNPIMLAFMGAQSFIMMYMAGEAWQYGKRKIGALSNEEFNKISPLDLLHEQQRTLKGAIPSIEKSMEEMTPMTKVIAKEMILAIPQLASGLKEGVVDVLTGGPTTVGPGPTQAGLLSGATPGVIQPGLDFWQNFWNALVGAVKASGGATGAAVTTITDPTISHVPAPVFGETHEKFGHPGHEHDQEEIIKAFGTTVLPPTPSKGGAPISKKKAGQSQIMERDKLIIEIKAAGDTVLYYLKLKQQGFADQAKAIMVAKQLALQQILDYYYF